MSNTPSDAEIEALVKRHGATSYRNRADTQNPAFGFSVAGLESLLAEVRKQDDALILQLVEALERAKKHHSTTSLPLVIENYGSRIKCANEGSIVWRDLVPSAITAARTRLATSTKLASNSTRTTNDRL